MRLIQSGHFRMGSPEGEKDRRPDEALHQVVLTKPFYLAAHPVTRAQFQRFVAADKWKTEAERKGERNTWLNPGFTQDDDHPVVCVSWNDAVAYCAWLGKLTGKMCGLPTEAQWEYACRGVAGPSGEVVTSADAYHFGNSITPEHANFVRNKIGGTRKVGSYAGNGFGLFDMHGNVMEWCADWYGSYSTAENNNTDPHGPPKGEARILRGGSWGCYYCRAAFRYSRPPTFASNRCGFRVSLCLD
jgi:formylglycine-generating enzyme